MASLNPGKAMAQASHASNAFVHEAENRYKKGRGSEATLFKMWQNETKQGFGTVLTLAVDEALMREVVRAAQKLDVFANTVHDPTYPLVDGEMVHYLPIDTCAYVFGDKNDPIMHFLVGDLPLHP